MGLHEVLSQFAIEHDFQGKGPLSLALIITDLARREGLPLDPESMKTPKAGQVRGLSGSAVRKILKRHGITRTLSSEGGRTSRGSLENMNAYVQLLNDLNDAGAADLDAIEAWWVERVRTYFRSEPFELRDTGHESIESVISGLLGQAAKRQSESTGSTYTGTMLQHLVGAKLDMVHPGGQIEHHSTSEADQPRGRAGDFLVGDYVVHATTSPSEALAEKCRRNVDAGLRPMIITLRDCIGAARQVCKLSNIHDVVEVITVEQFIATNIVERSMFRVGKRKENVLALLTRYNELVEQYESDPSMMVRFD